MITSWNEWHEDTQIEPVAIAPPTPIAVSACGVPWACTLCITVAVPLPCAVSTGSVLHRWSGCVA